MSGVMEGTAVSSQPVDWTDPRGVVAVGFDGSPASVAAVTFAVAEAVAAGQRLTLVTVLDRIAGVPTRATREADAHCWAAVLGIRDGIMAEHPDLDVRIDVQVGDPAERLAARPTNHAELVVGRDSGTGSTAAAVLGPSRVPVIVVPDGWRGHLGDGGPVVVAVLPGTTDGSAEAALRFASDRAERYGGPLRVVSPFGGGPVDSMELLEGAQMIVVARPDGGTDLDSVTRAVLRTPGVPVAVMPSMRAGTRTPVPERRVRPAVRRSKVDDGWPSGPIATGIFGQRASRRVLP